MATLSGTVLGQSDAPLANMPVNLLGSATVKVLLTDTTGKFAFTELTGGSYTLIVTHRVFNTASQQKVTIKDGEDPPAVMLRLSAEEPDSASDDRRFVWLKYAQYAFLMLIGAFYFYLIFLGIDDLTVMDLRELETARGVITYLVAVTTIAMAAMLMLAGIMTGGKDLSQRFTLGKEILTILIGVLGTIIGFYYGSTAKPDTAPVAGAGNSPAIKVNGFTPIPSDPLIGKSLTVTATVVGGQSPYSYTLTASPVGTVDTINKTANSERIIETVPVLTSASPGSARLILTGKDARGASFSASTTMNVKK